MAAPSLSTEAAAAGSYPSNRFGKRERQLLSSVKTYVDALQAVAATHRVVAGGSFTTVGGDANEAIVIAGALATDLAIAVLKTAGATPRTILTTAAATGQINLVMSGDPAADHVVTYLLLRAIS